MIIGTVVWLVGCANAVNLIDGMDGLAGGVALVAAGSVALLAGPSWAGWAGGLLAAGVAGFLPFNLAPARIFMGDVGSQFAGFVMAVLAVAAARFDSTQISFLIVPLLLFKQYPPEVRVCLCV